MNNKTKVVKASSTALIVFSILAACPSLAQAETPFYKISSKAVVAKAKPGSRLSASEESSLAKKIAATNNIRKALSSAQLLSNHAKNVKIIVDDNTLVTLRGVVRSPEEKKVVEQIASKEVGGQRVNSELEVNSRGYDLDGFKVTF